MNLTEIGDVYMISECIFLLSLFLAGRIYCRGDFEMTNEIISCLISSVCPSYARTWYSNSTFRLGHGEKRLIDLIIGTFSRHVNRIHCETMPIIIVDFSSSLLRLNGKMFHVDWIELWKRKQQHFIGFIFCARFMTMEHSISLIVALIKKSFIGEFVSGNRKNPKKMRCRRVISCFSCFFARFEDESDQLNDK